MHSGDGDRVTTTGSPHDRPPVRGEVPGESRVFLLLTVFLVGTSAALMSIGAALISEAAPWGVVSFELSGDAAFAARILASWSPAAREHAMLSLGLDYLYLVVYPLWFALAATRLARRQIGLFAKLGALVAGGSLLSGVFDAFENYGLVRMLTSGPTETWARVATACAAAKFSLLSLATLYLVGGLASLGISRMSGPPRQRLG